MRADDIRSWAWIVYGAALLIGTLVMVGQQPIHPVSFKATQNLAANQMLQAGDVAPASQTGLYTRRALTKGQILLPGDVEFFPELSVKKKNIPVALTISRELVVGGAINAGKHARLCDGNKLVLEALPVQAVLCAPHPGSCVAIVDFPADNAEALTAAFGDPAALVLKAPLPSPQACE